MRGDATERCVNGCFPARKTPWADKKLIFFENLKRLDVQNDINANGRAGFQKAEPAFSPASKSVLAGFKKPAKKPGRLFKKPAVCHSVTSQASS